jgi:hypothetical protein
MTTLLSHELQNLLRILKGTILGKGTIRVICASQVISNRPHPRLLFKNFQTKKVFEDIFMINMVLTKHFFLLVI